jgi:hypothetical protein
VLVLHSGLFSFFETCLHDKMNPLMQKWMSSKHWIDINHFDLSFLLILKFYTSVCQIKKTVYCLKLWYMVIIYLSDWFVISKYFNHDRCLLKKFSCPIKKLPTPPHNSACRFALHVAFIIQYIDLQPKSFSFSVVNLENGDHLLFLMELKAILFIP